MDVQLWHSDYWLYELPLRLTFPLIATFVVCYGSGTNGEKA